MRLLITLAVAALVADSLRAANPVLSTDGLTVYDSVNNITWLADANAPASNHFGLPVCNGNNPGIRTCLNASGSMNYNAAVAWVAAMNTANYLGHSNWQLPTTPVVDKNCGRVGPSGGNFGFGCTAGALDTIYNSSGLKSPATAVPIPANTVGPFTNLQPYLYWSRTSAGATQGNATFSFATGWQGANTLPNFLYILPMVPGKLPGAPAATGTALQLSADKQSVYDPMTNITWATNANLPAANAFGLPLCTDPLTPALCVAKDGAMTYASAVQFIANMNAAAYLGQTDWQLPSIDPACPGYGCDGNLNPLGNLFYAQLGFIPGAQAVSVPDITVGAFHNIQPYLYWVCQGDTLQSACSSDQPAPNFEWSYSFGSGFLGTDLLANSLYVTAYFVGSRVSPAGPEIATVANAEGESAVIAPNTWVEIKGANLAPAGDTRIWQGSDFGAGLQMPTQLDKVSVTVNGKNAYIYFISPTQINILTPPDSITGPVNVVVTNSGTVSAPFTVQTQSLSPSFFIFGGGPYVTATHADGSLLAPTTLFPSATPAKPGEIVVIYANGFGPTSMPLVTGDGAQSGTLSPLPVIQIGGAKAQVLFAGLVAAGEFQFNVIIPPTLSNGDQSITAAYNGSSTQAGVLITIHN